MNLPKLSCTKLTPNLVVSNVDASLRFYEDVLGFDRSMTFPEQSPFMFATVTSGPVKIFLSDRSTVTKEDPRLSGLSLGGGNIMLIEVDGVDTVHTRIASLVKVVMSLRTQSFGMREFAIQDPDGYVITFAEKVAKLRFLSRMKRVHVLCQLFPKCRVARHQLRCRRSVIG